MNLIRVALDVPVARLFDYRCDDRTAQIGARVLVPFGPKQLIGIIVARPDTSEVTEEKLKNAITVLDAAPLLSHADLRLLEFAADYYVHPLGAVIMATIPAALRRMRDRKRTPAASAPIVSDITKEGTASTPAAGPALTAEQSAAVKAITAALGAYQPLLLWGITGSGKTEVYLHAIAAALSRDTQVLLLVPEIALTPQLESLVIARFPGALVATLHSRLAEGERATRWQDARSGRARIVLGTRLSVFTPLPDLGLIIVDEEHDTSFKQGEGFRYSARDLAVVRARHAGVPVVLGSATPALETWRNAVDRRYRLLTLPERINARPPVISCVDLRHEKTVDGLSVQLIAAIGKRIAHDEQSMVFINRRGYAPVLMCGSCGWVSDCKRCSARLVLHLRERRLRCHHCGHDSAVPTACPQCGDADLTPVGQGTQRIEAALTKQFPKARILRVDRDSTRRKKAWQDMRSRIHERTVDILVGTQILAKGHDFPHLNLVGVINADSMLYSNDFRAAERLYALLTQVAGRAGRGDQQGEVLVQTEFAGHPLYAALRGQNFDAHARSLLAERQQAGFPPYVHQALLRAEARTVDIALQFLAQAARSARRMKPAITIYDPVPANMMRKAGRERAHLLVQSPSRTDLRAFLNAWHAHLAQAASTAARWSLDVDPAEF